MRYLIRVSVGMMALTDAARGSTLAPEHAATRKSASSTGSDQPNLSDYGISAKQSIRTADEALGKRGQQVNLVNPEPGNQSKTTPTPLAERGDPYEGGGSTVKQLVPLFARGGTGSKEICLGSHPFSHTSLPVEDSLPHPVLNGLDTSFVREASASGPFMNLQAKWNFGYVIRPKWGGSDNTA
ncbi:hypothetical protein NDU88_003520 [Pleurodeles waltl]|uniref:Uncharacterized protein n=1 Tax=Pleurodeles waltl TaxID=8319 RepID=A0AAV7LFK5_PLEWA|nr:hypothetical protein NDU88_003520 [Pleurodeles waltl]